MTGDPDRPPARVALATTDYLTASYAAFGAMAAIHARPAVDWSVQQLAQEVAMSPSRFAARFAESLGDSPMAYVTKLRMNVACKMLATSQTKIEQVASDVGYDSAAAFNRAFKSHLGLAPGAWRAQRHGLH